MKANISKELSFVENSCPCFKKIVNKEESKGPGTFPAIIETKSEPRIVFLGLFLSGFQIFPEISGLP